MATTKQRTRDGKQGPQGNDAISDRPDVSATVKCFDDSPETTHRLSKLSRREAKTIKIEREKRRRSKYYRLRDNSIMKLPGELRNKIYRLVLRQKHSIVMRKVTTKNNSWENLRCEPPLLRVSKQIRKESMGVFYQINKFRVPIRSYHAKEAYERLTSISEQSGLKTYSNFRLDFDEVKSKWADIPSWIWLAKLAFEMDLRFFGSLDLKGKKWQSQLIGVTIPNAMAEAFALGLKARIRETSGEWLIEDFKDWVESRIHFYGSLNNQKYSIRNNLQSLTWPLV